MPRKKKEEKVAKQDVQKLSADACRCGRSLEVGQVEFQGTVFCDFDCPAYKWQTKHPNEQPPA